MENFYSFDVYLFKINKPTDYDDVMVFPQVIFSIFCTLKRQEQYILLRLQKEQEYRLLFQFLFMMSGNKQFFFVGQVAFHFTNVTAV